MLCAKIYLYKDKFFVESDFLKRMEEQVNRMNNQESLFEEVESHLLGDPKPSVYLEELYGRAVFSRYPWKLLKQLGETQQSPVHHPEGDVWNHTMLVVDEAARIRLQSRDPRAFMWAVLLHDIGKPATTRVHKGKITAYDHDKAGEKISREFLSYFTEDEAFIQAVSSLVRYHMQILFIVKEMPFADLKGMRRSTDIREIALLGLCDRLGRGTHKRREEEANIKKFIEMCQ